jgi:hypothetical protein
MEIGIPKRTKIGEQVDGFENGSFALTIHSVNEMNSSITRNTHFFNIANVPNG